MRQVLFSFVVTLHTGCTDPAQSPTAAEESPTTAATADDTSATELPRQRAFIAIHADHHNDPICAPGEEDAPEWAMLVDVIARADSLGHRITIMLRGIWGDCIASDPAKLSVVQGWVADGHEIAHHHHDCSHVDPDGFRNEGITGCTDNAKCRKCKCEYCDILGPRGTAEEAWGMVKQLEALLIARGVSAEKAAIQTAAQGPETGCGTAQGICYRQFEWSAERRYATAKVEDFPASSGATYKFITKAGCSITGDGARTYRVPTVGHSQIPVGSLASARGAYSLSVLQGEIQTVKTGVLAESEATLGIVFHPFEYDATITNNPTLGTEDEMNDRAYIDAVLEALADAELWAIPARDILRDVDCSEFSP